MPTARDRGLLTEAARVNADAGAALISMLDELEDGELRLDALRDVAIRLSDIANKLLSHTEASGCIAEPPAPRGPEHRLTSRAAP